MKTCSCATCTAYLNADTLEQVAEDWNNDRIGTAMVNFRLRKIHFRLLSGWTWDMVNAEFHRVEESLASPIPWEHPANPRFHDYSQEAV